MPLVVVDVAIPLPETLHTQAVALSGAAADELERRGSGSFFRLGAPHVNHPADGRCEPHVSLYMLEVEQSRIPEMLRVLADIVTDSAPLDAVGAHYSHNAQGALEVFFVMTPQWRRLQCRVIAALEPERCGRLRPSDPSGASLRDVVKRLEREAPGGAQLRQLRAYGYDEVTDEAADRFRPHVTLAWPVDGCRADWSAMPPATSFSGFLDQLAIFQMGPHGTCIHHYGGVRLAGPGVGGDSR
jgi:hypothetical protein